MKSRYSLVINILWFFSRRHLAAVFLIALWYPKTTAKNAGRYAKKNPITILQIQFKDRYSQIHFQFFGIIFSFAVSLVRSLLIFEICCRRHIELSTKGAYHLSELASRTGPSVNGTHEFWELKELVLAKLAQLMKLGRSVLSALRGTRKVCSEICDGKCLVSPGARQSQLSVFFVQWAAYQMYMLAWGRVALVQFRSNLCLV